MVFFTQAYIMTQIEKSFVTGYPFMHIDAFMYHIRLVNPIKGKPNYGDSLFLYHIRVLLIVSTLTGIKMSQLIQLTWIDILEFSPSHFPKVKKRLKYKRHDIPLIGQVEKELKNHYNICNKPRINDYIFTADNGEPLNPRNLSRDIRKGLEELGFAFFNEFKTDSTLIMFGRSVINVHGYNKRVIQELKKHLNFHSELQLLEFLHIDTKVEKRRRNFHENLITGINEY